MKDLSYGSGVAPHPTPISNTLGTSGHIVRIIALRLATPLERNYFTSKPSGSGKTISYRLHTLRLPIAEQSVRLAERLTRWPHISAARVRFPTSEREMVWVYSHQGNL